MIVSIILKRDNSKLGQEQRKVRIKIFEVTDTGLGD